MKKAIWTFGRRGTIVGAGASAVFVCCLVGCAGGSSAPVTPLQADDASVDAVATNGAANTTAGGARVPAGNEPPNDGAPSDGAPGIGAETASSPIGRPQGPMPADSSAGGSAEEGGVQACGAGEQAAISSGLPTACAMCLCTACPKEFGPPTGMDDPAIIGDIEAGFEPPGSSNAQGCGADCWLFWACMYMNGCAELNTFDEADIITCLTSHCLSQYSAIGGKWPNDQDLCSSEKSANPVAGERACSAVCQKD